MSFKSDAGSWRLFPRSMCMRKKILLTLILAGAGFIVAIQIASGQGRGGATAEQIARRQSLEKELRSVAIIERKLMAPMRDGKRMATDVHRPKDSTKKYPTVFVPTPYNLNFLDRPNSAARGLRH